MKPLKLMGGAVLAAIAALFLNGCTGDNHITDQTPEDMAHVHGTVYAWKCGVGDWLNNRHGVERTRFSVNTGEPAIVAFVRDSDPVSVAETDDSSNFDLYLSAGSYKIAIETGFIYPADTFYNVLLEPGDTTLVLDIIYQVLDPLHITFVFGYSSIHDTVSTQVEWEIILELNDRTFSAEKGFPVLNIGWISSPSEWRIIHENEFTPRAYAYYELPVYREYKDHGKIYNVIEAFDLLQRVIDDDTTGIVPASFGIHPTGSYVCVD